MSIGKVLESNIDLTFFMYKLFFIKLILLHMLLLAERSIEARKDNHYEKS